MLLEHVTVRRLLVTWLGYASRSISVSVYYWGSCFRQNSLCVLSRGLVQCCKTFVFRAIFVCLRGISVLVKPCCCPLRLRQSLHMPVKFLCQCTETCSLTSTLISRSLFALRLKSYFWATSYSSGLKYHSSGDGHTGLIFAAKIDSKPANVFLKMETCRPFLKLDFLYMPQGLLTINFDMGLHYSYYPWRQRLPISITFRKDSKSQQLWRNRWTLSLMLLFWTFRIF
jgi:hypothetical protein